MWQLVFFIVVAIVSIGCYAWGYSDAKNKHSFDSTEKSLRLMEIYENHIKHKDDLILELTLRLTEANMKAKKQEEEK